MLTDTAPQDSTINWQFSPYMLHIRGSLLPTFIFRFIRTRVYGTAAVGSGFYIRSQLDARPDRANVIHHVTLMNSQQRVTVKTVLYACVQGGGVRELEEV